MAKPFLVDAFFSGSGSPWGRAPFFATPISASLATVPDPQKIVATAQKALLWNFEGQ